MNFTKKIIMSCLLTATFSFSAFSQQRLKAYDDYILEYKNLAVDHMEKYRIPASIKLAQGILESGAGKSFLAQQGNNHFGIKCKSSWTGPTVNFTDDAPDECFRSYSKVKDSYEDHSLFLIQNSRYASLFKLEVTDYKGWAQGLQDAYYASDRAYASKLINLIEKYELYSYDSKGKKTDTKTDTKKDTQPIQNNSSAEDVKLGRDIYKTPSGLLYVEVKEGESIASIARELGFNERDLIKYNDIPDANYPLNKNDVVYLEKKKKKVDPPLYYHLVANGESMHSISQRYGIRMENLYKINKKDPNYVPTNGEQLKLR